MSIPFPVPSACLTSLDREEFTEPTSGNWEPSASELSPDKGTVMRHSGWANDRSKVFEAMKRAGFSASRLARFAECGSGAWLLVKEGSPSEWRLAANHCKDRFCKVCQATRTRALAANVAEFIKPSEHRFITLTVKSNDNTLTEQIDHLLDSFKRLRRSKEWKFRVKGGVAFMEITFNQRSKQWHPHLHCVVDCSFWLQRDLSLAWHVASKDSFIVDVRQIRNRQYVARYIVKYATKPIPAALLYDPSRLTEMMLALTGRRLIQTFGDWRAISLTRTSTSEGWICLMSLDDCFWKAEHGDPFCEAVVRELVSRSCFDNRLPENFSP
jgi:hypothetical protein